MSSEESSPNRIRDALARIYEEQPPHFKEYLRRYKEDPKSRVFAPLAEAYRRQGKLEEAIQICQEGLTHHPEFHGGRVALAKCFLDKKWYDNAKKELEWVVERVPENLMAQRLLGQCHENSNDFDAALHAYKMALFQAPEDAALAEHVAELEKKTRQPKPIPAEPAVESSMPGPVEESVETSPGTQIRVDEIEKDESAVRLVPTVTDDGQIEMVPLNPDEGEHSVERVLGFSDEDEDQDGDGFKVAHVSHVFQKQGATTEITTETLGDLYFRQGQFDKSLRIFESLGLLHPSAELEAKIERCRAKLGVNQEVLVREKKIKALQGVLNRLQGNDSLAENESLPRPAPNS